MIFIRSLMAFHSSTPWIVHHIPASVAHICNRLFHAGSMLTIMSDKSFLKRWFSSFTEPPLDEETEIYQEIRMLLNEPRNGNYLLKNSDIRSVESLCQLTHHHNGFLREKAVMALSLKGDIAALRELLICANDWVKPIHRLATQEVMALMTAENAPAFIAHLAQVRQLLTCRRYNHAPLVELISHFLASQAHIADLRQALYSPDRELRHAVLHTLIEQEQLHDEAALAFVLDTGDTYLRGIAVTYWLARAPKLSESLMTRLLRDPWPRIRRDTLFYLDEHGQALPETLHRELLLDKNSLIRQRARHMLSETIDATAFWRDVITSPACSITQRRSALYGLKEARDAALHSLALWGYSQPENGIRQAALHILLTLEGEEAKPRILAALADPSLSFAMAAMKSLAHHPLSFSRSELEALLTHTPSEKHTLLYWRLVHQINKWDWLIVLLRHFPFLSPSQQAEELASWKGKYNQAGINPTSGQQEILTCLLAQAPEIRRSLQHYLV